MIKTVGLELHWLPKDIGSLFVDGDYESLEYWYNTIKNRE